MSAKKPGLDGGKMPVKAMKLREIFSLKIVVIACKALGENGCFRRETGFSCYLD